MNDTDLLDDRSTTGGVGDGHPGPASAPAAPAAGRPRRASSRPAGATAPGGAATATEPTATATKAAAPKAAGSLSGLLLPELQRMAGGLGITGTARLRKGQLIAAIQEARGLSGAASNGAASNGAASNGSSSNGASSNGASSNGSGSSAPSSDGSATESAAAPLVQAVAAAEVATQPAREAADRTTQRRPERAERPAYDRNQNGQSQNNGQNPGGNAQNDRNQGGNAQNDRNQGGNNQGGNNQAGQNNGAPRAAQDDDPDGGNARGRRGRYRDRRRGRERTGTGTGSGGSGQGNGPGAENAGGNDRETQVREDDVLAPVAGILDTSDNYAFLRTSGYLAGPSDVYVSMNLVRRHGLRRGDALTGAVKANATEAEQQGNRREKYNPLVRLDTVNGQTPEESKNRPEFGKLVPLYPQERLRLETEPTDLVTRVIDLVMPIGKGQRALIVSPPKAGKTTVLQRIANAITQNNPECHLMVVLVDERPEEVTDMQRSVKGEVIASTFDRPSIDHTVVAELAIERAKRLVELGHDVVVLLDSITRLGRAYNLAAPASGRIMSGGVDSTALYPPKRFLGAARNVENGGSLTILATALVETGSQADTVIYEEFKGTGNAELKLDRKIADKRVFPAVDIAPSGTRKDDLLMSHEEMAIMIKLRRVLQALDSQQAIDLLIDKLKHTRTNIEFLMQIAKSTPGQE